MCPLVIALLVGLCVIHQDFWWWGSTRMVLGFIPVGLAWHAFLSVAASIVWYLATLFCWPRALTLDPSAGLNNEHADLQVVPEPQKE